MYTFDSSLEAMTKTVTGCRVAPRFYSQNGVLRSERAGTGRTLLNYPFFFKKKKVNSCSPYWLIKVKITENLEGKVESEQCQWQNQTRLIPG